MTGHHINLLPVSVYELIAAGEVVTDPAAVVKELTENSIDAGANTIDIKIVDGGRSLIRITDNGIGIAPDELEMAFTSHATSKISTENDLYSISALGFRGEALASVAAVSKMKILSRTADEPAAAYIYKEGGITIDSGAEGAPVGTTVTVSDLFYNTPARMKFLGSDRSETRKISEFLSKIAVAYPDIRFSYSSNDKLLFHTDGTGDSRRAILNIYGSSLSENLLFAEFASGSSSMKLKAFISGIGNGMKTRHRQHFFVNGRAVKSSVFTDSVSKAYREFEAQGRYPAVFLFLETDPESIDVNVHPAKSEIRFNDPVSAEKFICESVRAVLLSSGAIPKISDFGGILKMRNAEKEFYKLSENLEAGDVYNPGRKSSANQVSGSNYCRILENIDAAESGDISLVNINSLSSTKSIDEYDLSDIAASESDTVFPTFEEPQTGQQVLDIGELRILGSIFATYIIAENSQNVYIIDQHAAHERVNYERLLRKAIHEEVNADVQELLDPFIADIPAASKTGAPERIELLKRLGFDAESFGESSVIVRAVPGFMSLGEAIDFITDILGEEAASRNNGMLSDAALSTLIARACKSSVRANQTLSDEEKRELLDSLSKCDNPLICPHGRPVFVSLSQHDLERMFNR